MPNRPEFIATWLAVQKIGAGRRLDDADAEGA